METISGDERQVKLVEYQKAQDSAEHHDRLLWQAVGLLTAGMAALVAITGSPPSNQTTFGRFYPPVFGIILSGFLVFFVWSFGRFRKQKYDRCKVLESELGMQQHSLSRGTSQRLVVYIFAGFSVVGWLVRLCFLK